MSSEILKNYIDDLFKVDEESKEKFDIYFCNICNIPCHLFLSKTILLLGFEKRNPYLLNIRKGGRKKN
jgi:hypothetical protein